jgi:hypothetical protein
MHCSKPHVPQPRLSSILTRQHRISGFWLTLEVFLVQEDDGSANYVHGKKVSVAEDSDIA